jgi:ribosome-associated translation inhibitor RaiA
MVLAASVLPITEEIGLMQILVTCNDPLCCDENLFQRVEGVIAGTLERFSNRVARVEVNLSDVTDLNYGNRDRICSLQAWVGTESVVASHEAATLTEAIHDAASKLERLLARAIEQRDAALGDRQGGPSPASR